MQSHDFDLPAQGDDDESWLPPVPDAVDLVVEIDAMMSMVAADRYRRVAAMRREILVDSASRGHILTEVMERSVRLELAMALRVTEADAGRLIAEAVALDERYPAIMDSLSGARLTSRHATILVETLDGVEPEFTDEILAEGIRLGESLPIGSFRRRLRELVDAVRAVTLTQRYEEALQTRRVVTEPAADAMAWLHILAPAVAVHAIHGRVTAQAKALIAGNPDDERTLDQARADVVTDLLIDGTSENLPPAARGIRATVAVTVPVLTLLDTDTDTDNDNDTDADADTDGTAPRGFPTVEGIGPIPVAVARDLAGTADGWMRVLTHPETGIVLSVGRDQYKPPPALRRLVKWRAETCMAPGCNMPASRCEIDHTLAWEEGGHTSLWNLAPFCTGHHTVKHHGDWHVQQIPDSGGTILWTSPTGRQYTVRPARPVPAFRPSTAHDPADAHEAAPF